MTDGKDCAAHLRDDGHGRWRQEWGASLVEYALLVALIAVVCIGAVTAFGSATGNSLTGSGNSIVSAN